MTSGNSERNDRLRYQADEHPPAVLSIGLGVQLAGLNLAAIMLIPTVVMRAAGQSEDYVAWAVTASVAICGITTVLQALRFGRIGAKYMIVMGSSGAFMPVCVAALVQSGPAMLATLVLVSCLVPFALSWRLSLFQRILTPAVSGTVVMLIPITLLPIAGDMLTGLPDISPPPGGVASIVLTLATIAGIAFAGRGALRLWSPVIGVAVGTTTAAFFGLYDFGRVSEAAWVGLPKAGWPGFEIGPEFFTLLPGFLLAGVVASIRTMAGAIAIQRVSWRRNRATDFRAVQGAMTVDGLATLFSGVTGTVPSTAYSVSVSMAELTGVAARAVGVAAGVFFIALPFFPKVLAAILAIPDPVFGTYLVILLATLFMVGVRMALQGGLDYRKSFIIGIAFLVGVCCHYGLVFPREISEFAGGLFRNGMNSGGLTAIILSALVGVMRPRRPRLNTELDPSALPLIKGFLIKFGEASGLAAEMISRLQAVAQEAVLTFISQNETLGKQDRRGLILSASREGGGAVLEFVVAARHDNIEDRIALLGEQHEEQVPEQDDPSLRLLRQLSSSVHHQQFHDTDIVTLRVVSPGG